MSGGRKPALLVCAGMTACGPAPQDLFLMRHGEALIVARVAPGGAPDLTSYALAAGLPPITREVSAGNEELTTLFYDHSLAELRLPTGPISLDSNAELLPAADAIVTLQSELEPAFWAELPELPESLRMVRVAKVQGCSSFVTHDFSLPGTPNDRVQAAIVIAPDRAFLLTANPGRGWLVDAERAQQSSFSPRANEWIGLWRDATADEIWAFGAFGDVEHGHPDRGFLPGPPIPIAAGDRVESISGSDTSSPGEVFAITASTAVYQLEAGAWRERLPPSATPPEPFIFRRVTWVAPGHAVAVGVARASALELDVSGTRNFPLEGLEGGLGSDRAQTLHTLPGWGPLVGTRSGRLLSRQGTRFAPFAQRLGGQIRVLAPLDGGILFGGDDGVLAEFRANLTDCEPKNYALTSDQPVDFLLPLAGAFIAISRIGKATDLPIIVLTR